MYFKLQSALLWLLISAAFVFALGSRWALADESGFISASFHLTEVQSNLAVLARLDASDGPINAPMRTVPLTAHLKQHVSDRQAITNDNGVSLSAPETPETSASAFVYAHLADESGALTRRHSLFGGAQYFVASLGPIELQHTNATEVLSKPIADNPARNSLPDYVRYSLEKAAVHHAAYDEVMGRHQISLNQIDQTPALSWADFSSKSLDIKSNEIDLGVASFDSSGSFGFSAGQGKLSVKLRDENVRLLYIYEF